MFKKFLSALFSLAVMAGIGVAIYLNQTYVKTQLNKVVGVYYVSKGDHAYSKGELHKAIVLYNKAVKLYPEHYTAWYNLGNLYVTYEDYFSALYSYSQAFKHNKNMVVARMNYGIIATQKLGDFDSAINQYQIILKTRRTLLNIPYIYNNKVSYKDNLAIAHYNLGVTYRLKSLYSNENWEIQRRYLSRAIGEYKESIKINPNSYDAQYNLGLAYQLAGDLNRAGKYYCNAIKLSPMSYEAHYNLAILLRKQSRFKEAYQEIDKASTLITALNENSATQQYAAIMMNDILRSYYTNPAYKNKLKAEIAKKKQYAQINKKKKPKKKQETVMVNGKIKASDDLDKQIFENFSKCSF